MVGEFEVREYVASCDVDGGRFAKATAPLHPIKVEPEVWRMVRVLVLTYATCMFPLLSVCPT